MDTPEAGTPRVRGLPQRYPPPDEALDADGSVTVHVRAHIMQLTSIDSKEQVFKAVLWLQVRAARGRCRARVGCAWIVCRRGRSRARPIAALRAPVAAASGPQPSAAKPAARGA